ncbi:hypothetical protein Tco_0834952 [Tanacetum coccineum]
MRSEKAKEKEKGVVLIDEEEPPKKQSTTNTSTSPTMIQMTKVKVYCFEEKPELDQRLHEEELAELDRAQKERQKPREAHLSKTTSHTIEERARLLAEFFKRRKKQLAAERAEAIRNKPPTRTQKLYEKEKKWIDDFKPIDDDSQQQAESTKEDQEQDSEKKVPRNIQLE